MTEMILRLSLQCAGCSIIIAVLSAISIPNTALKEVVKIVGSLCMIAVLLTSVTQVCANIPEKIKVFDKNRPTEKIEQAQEKNDKIIINSISDKISEYIEESAFKKGVNCYVKVIAFTAENNEIEIERIDITYPETPSKEEIAIVSRIIKEECGVEEELQNHL